MIICCEKQADSSAATFTYLWHEIEFLTKNIEKINILTYHNSELNGRIALSLVLKFFFLYAHKIYI